jgi:hypothetical protein
MNTALDVYTFSCATGFPTSHRSSGDGLLRRFSDQVDFDQTNVGDVCIQAACRLALGCLHVLLFILPTAAAAVVCNQAGRTGDKTSCYPPIHWVPFVSTDTPHAMTCGAR